MGKIYMGTKTNVSVASVKFQAWDGDKKEGGFCHTLNYFLLNGEKWYK